MAITVTNRHHRGDSYDGAYGGSNIGSGAGGGTADDSFVQGTNAWGRKIGTANAERGFETTITSFDATLAGSGVLMAKGLILNNPALNSEGLRIRVGSGSSDYEAIIIGDDGTRGDVTYPAKGGWVIRPIDVNISSWIDETAGTASLSAITLIGVTGNVSTVAKDLNVFLDASDFSPGLFLVGNTPDGTWQDFIDHDEGTAANRFGHVTTVEGIIYVFGGMVIGRNAAGTTSATTFTDSNQTIVYPGGSVDVGWNFLELDITNASTAITLNAITHIGRGRNDRKRYFDSELEVNSGTDRFTIPSHGFTTGDAILYSDEGGTTITGLTDLTEYFPYVVDADTFELLTSRQEAIQQLEFGLETPVNVTAAGSGAGQNHSFRRQPTTLPDLIITGTGGTFAGNSSAFNNFRQITGTSKATFDACIFTGIKNFDLVSATLTDCLIDQPLGSAGEAAVTASADESGSISGTEFIANSDIHLAGHAIEIDSAPTADLGFVGNNFTDWGPTHQTFNPSTDVDVDADDRIDITGHPYTTGDPVYYMINDPDTGVAGTVISGLTTNTLYYVQSISANEITLHLTREGADTNTNVIGLTAGSNETHVLYSAYAAIHNSSTADVVIGVSGGGDVPSYRNSSTGTVSITNAVTIRVEGLTEGAACKCIANETVGTLTAGDVIFEQLADANGVAELTTFNYEAAFGTGVDVIIRTSQQGLPTAALQSDNGTFTDYTTAANSTTIDDMDLFPATPVVTEDSFYFGHAEQFNRLKIELTDLGAGGFGILWQYWNGAWTNLSGVSDGTSDFTLAGEKIVSWTLPGDWTQSTEGGLGPYYYVRALYNSGVMSTNPTGRKAQLDVKRYLASELERTVTSAGLTTTAFHVEDTIAKFVSTD